MGDGTGMTWQYGSMSATIVAMPESPAFQPVLLIREAGQTLAILQRDVAEILPLPRLSAVPGAPPILLGCFSLGQTAVFVLPLNSLLGLSGPAEGTALYHHLLLLQARDVGPRLALRVDRVTELVQAEPSGLTGRDTFNGCVQGEIRHGEGAVPLLSVPDLLTTYERERLFAFAARQSTRAALFRPVEPS
jgi:chemotaxis signal transduction protein